MTVTVTGNQLFARLVNLRNSTGEQHYLRISLADKLLKDKDWVESPTGGGGDESKAIDRLEEDCFGDLCGMISLPQLLEIFHHVPDIKYWKEERYNLKKIWAKWRASQPQKNEKPKKEPRTVTVQNHEFPSPSALLEMTNPQIKNEYTKVLKIVEKSKDREEVLEQENKNLREENARLKEENSRLRKGLRELANVG